MRINKSLVLAGVLLLLGASSSLFAQSKSSKVDYGYGFNFCNFELIETTGTMNFVIARESVDENGCVHYAVHFNSQNVKGIGLDTGNEYRIIDVLSQQGFDQTVCSDDGCTVDFQTAATWKVKTKDGTSFTSHGNYHVIINFCTFEVVEVRANFHGGCD